MAFRWASKRLPRADTLLAMSIPIGAAAVLLEAYLRTEMNDTETPLACSYAPTSKIIQPHHLQELHDRGIVVIPSVMSNAALQAARREIDTSTLNKSFQKTANDDDVRQDSVVWVKEALQGDNQQTNMNGIVGVDGAPLLHCLRLIRGVTHALLQIDGGNVAADSRPDNTVNNYRVPRQCQLALYPGNLKACYHRHLDACIAPLSELGLLEWLRLSDYRARSITVILYLNEPNRPVQDGGALRCWVNDDAAFDVQPKGGTLVIFQSDKVEHMVLPSSVDRYALTSWVFGET